MSDNICQHLMITISNLYPRPDQPTRGMFNSQMFGEMRGILRSQKIEVGSAKHLEGEACRAGNQSREDYLNICLVPEWRVWRWQGIRKWSEPEGGSRDRRQCGRGAPRRDGDLEIPSSPRVAAASNRSASGGERASHIEDENSRATTYLPVFYLPLIGRSINWWFYYRSLRSLFIHHSSFINLKSQISLLASWLYPDAVAAARLAQDLGLPVWLRVHGTDRYHLKNHWRRRLILDAVTYARGVMCNCQAVSDDLVKWGVPADKIHIIPNGVDTGLFRYRSKEEAGDSEPPSSGGRGLPSRGVPYTDKSRVVLFIGNLVPIKGPDILLKAFACLGNFKVRGQCGRGTPCRDGNTGCLTPSTIAAAERASHIKEEFPLPVFNLLIIGSGPMQRRLERQARELGIADRVHFLGNRPHEEVARWMNVADVLCLPSRSEGMPNVVVEALASGLPVVATAVGACPELLAGEPEARLCQSGDIAGLAQALDGVLCTPPDRKALATRNSRKYSWHIAAETILNLLGEKI